MTHSHLFRKHEAERPLADPGAREPLPSELDPELLQRLAELETPALWTPRAGRRTTREKFAAGLSGIKHALRGDSSFFAHAYRGILIALTATLLGVPPVGWCLLVFNAALVLVAEMAHSAIDTLARALGDPDEPRVRIAREIAAGGVLVAAVTSGAVTITVLTVTVGNQFGWWR